jgi:GT2 family glycosyltransferase
MYVSMIVPTYNGAHKLPILLQALKQQVFTNFELIVVVDGSTDDTIEVLEKLRTSFPRLRIITQQNRGRAAVRNNGARHAKGNLLIFFDDDMLPLPTCVAEHVAHHTTHPGSILVGGICEMEGEKDFQKFRASLSRKWLHPLRENEHQPIKKESLYLTAANCSILRDSFFNLGGFDERLTDAEDYELALRAQKAGVFIYYRHAAFAWHNDNATGKTYIKRLRQYNKAHKKLIDSRYALNANKALPAVRTPKGVKKLVFLFFTTGIWVRVLDNGVLAQLLPKKLRYKLYDLIVTANGVYFPDKVAL